jgi:hypothetical protein
MLSIGETTRSVDVTVRVYFIIRSNEQMPSTHLPTYLLGVQMYGLRLYTKITKESAWNAMKNNPNPNKRKQAGHTCYKARH